MATPRNRGLTTSGVLPRKADREQLNDERGVKPLPVNDSRDVSRVGGSSTRVGKGALLYSAS